MMVLRPTRKKKTKRKRRRRSQTKKVGMTRELLSHWKEPKAVYAANLRCFNRCADKRWEST